MPQLNSIRCSNNKCGKQIAKGYIEHGSISIKCKCGTETTITNIPKNEAKTGMTLGTITAQELSR